jgi:hypothetical protein
MWNINDAPTMRTNAINDLLENVFYQMRESNLTPKDIKAFYREAERGSLELYPVVEITFQDGTSKVAGG